MSIMFVHFDFNIILLLPKTAPLISASLLTSAMLIQEDINPDDPLYRELQTISDETLRCRKIVTSLLDFARQTTPAKKLNDIKYSDMKATTRQKLSEYFAPHNKRLTELTGIDFKWDEG